MLVPHLPLALEYYNKITFCKNETELLRVAGEIKDVCLSNPDFKDKWRNWLADIFTSHKETLNASERRSYEKFY